MAAEHNPEKEWLTTGNQFLQHLVGNRMRLIILRCVSRMPLATWLNEEVTVSGRNQVEIAVTHSLA